MSEHIQNNDGFLRKVIVPFLIYVALFIGTGFISGAVVHYPVAPTRNLIIGIIGATLFTIATTINEALFNKKNLREEGVIKFILFSLLLSLGIGMVSGGRYPKQIFLLKKHRKKSDFNIKFW